MCLALSVAYWLNLDEPYWAMTSAAVVSFPTVGGVISKSFGRIAGSLLGACAALLLAGHTLNDPWLFLFSISAWIALCTWACAMFTITSPTLSSSQAIPARSSLSGYQYH
ncbi:fusaric acid resistance protein [Klebsiella grimontii]|uniref:Fusaric acid resistance protein n=1 Tax=Klebsiella grimontii TaxID=2058152 RepID=A0A7H4P2M2_9ENTR|nr:fusaric acid resistance protein [Klebsiella grimontii]